MRTVPTKTEVRIFSPELITFYRTLYRFYKIEKRERGKGLLQTPKPHKLKLKLLVPIWILDRVIDPMRGIYRGEEILGYWDKEISNQDLLWFI